MSSPNLPLSGIVSVSVYISPQSALPPAFNVGLIGGSSARIPSMGANSRVVSFTSLQAMLTYGFLNTDPEYLAAELYFSQSPAPLTVQIGRQDSTALIGGAVDAAGSGYAVGDTGTIAGGTSGKLATYQVLTLSGSGVATFKITSGGTGYTAAVGAATTATSGSGTGFTVTTTGDVGETPLIALQACRAASSLWYACMWTGAVTADAEAIVAYLQATAQPPSFYFHTTSDAAVLNGQTNNLGLYLGAAGYTRCLIDYATTQGGAAPNNAYACAAAMGVMMGLNTGLAGSYFTLKFKQLVGVIPEPLTSAQIAAIEGSNVNLYLGYQGPYTILEQGTTPVTNTFADQILNQDMLTSAMQINVMNTLVGLGSVPQTDPGETQLIAAVNNACQAAVVRGWLAPGTWDGPQIVISSTQALYPGDAVPAGYKTMAPQYNTQSPANRAARQAMPIYCAITPAGAVHSLAIGVYVSL
jgi:hypothetical protein